MRERRGGDNPPTMGVLPWWLVVGAVVAIFIVYALIGSRGSTHTTAQARPAVVNVNTASLAELRALPHVSEAVAQAIIDGRPYSSADDLIRVYGIGQKTLDGIRPYVKVNDEHPQP